ncbi:MAG: hypothetical protein U9Q39_07245, partial [Pseudomonadota bacterium]|nr:hypothetical protein [Pseudomonadota bacterium]
DSFLTGLIVPENEVATLSEKFSEIVTEAGFSGFIHATDLTKSKKFTTQIADKFVKTIRRSKAIPFMVQYVQDVYTDMPEQMQDTYAVNRYLNMAQAAIEHFLFLKPDFFGQDLVFNLHPNSRVLKITKEDEHRDVFQAMGFRSLLLDKDTPGDPDKWLTFTWGNDALRSYLHRMATDYLPWQDVIGKRSWEKVETVVASKSSDPFVAWVDILTWLSRSVIEHKKFYKQFKNAHESLKGYVKTVIVYGLENEQYRELVRQYLAHDMNAFFPGALKALAGFSSDYYKKNIQTLISQSLTRLNPESFDEIVKLEVQVDSFLRNSRGNWEFVLQLTDHVLRALTSLPVPRDEKKLQQIKVMYIRLLGHKISVYNHRGNTSSAWRIFEKIKSVQYRPSSIHQFREWLELENRMAVACANNFSFEESNEIIAPAIEALEQSLKPLSDLAGYGLADSQLGKLRGTRGQNYGFLALREGKYFTLAEGSFIAAGQEFSKPDDRMRHDVNLLHLYLDWGKQDLAADCLQTICDEDSAFGRFLHKPSSKNAKYMQFGLSVLLKFKLHYSATAEYDKLVKKFFLAHLQ